MAGVRAQPDAPEEFYDDPELDLDQSWDVLTQVLSVGSSAASYAGQSILGGTPFGEDQGYGPPRTFDVEQVAAIADELVAISDERFRELFAAADLTDCYSASNYDVNAALEEFRSLRACYQTAAAARRAMVLFM